MASLQELLTIMKSLRDPVKGCPWDIEQDFHSIAPYTIEEAYEVADAIARDDFRDLKDELGDLLFQVVFHAQMASERGEFGFEDVVRAVNDKLIRRHPHVFADDSTIDSARAQTIAWENHKEQERKQQTSRLSEPSSVLNGVAVGLPGLTRAVKLQKRAARVGFDWASIGPVMEKVREELHELDVEIGETNNAVKIEEELGDLIFAIANLARHANVDPETAIRKSNQKFINRFMKIEKHYRDHHKSIQHTTLDELETVYRQVKQAEKDGEC